jgi:hypothetical protein
MSQGDTFQDNVVGGPSIVFCRLHGIHFNIRGESGKPCKAILGYDANSLYLWCTGQKMPIGVPFTYSPTDEGFGEEVSLSIVHGLAEK